MKKTLLVIGGTGFFGKCILDAFARGLLKSWSITRLVVMSRNSQELLQACPQLVGRGVELMTADITDVQALPEADYVIHAAASTDVRDYLSKGIQEKRNIQAGTYNYCELAKKFHQKSKIVYVSSGAVYGVQPESMKQIDEEFLASDMINMDAGKLDYAIAKQDAEKAVKKLGASGLNVSIARCFAFVGAWLPRDKHFAIGNFIGDITNKRPIIVKAKHKVYRSYMYADDLVEWLMTLADFASTKAPVYNVGSDESILVGDLANKLAKVYNVQAVTPLITETKIDRYIPSIKKAKNDLGLYLKYNLDSSIRETMKKIESINEKMKK